MRIALYIFCCFAIAVGVIGILNSEYQNDILIGGILYIPALFSLVYLVTHESVD